MGSGWFLLITGPWYHKNLSFKPTKLSSVKLTSIFRRYGPQLSYGQFSSTPEVPDLCWEFLKKPCLALTHWRHHWPNSCNKPTISLTRWCICIFNRREQEGGGKEGKETQCPFSRLIFTDLWLRISNCHKLGLRMNLKVSPPLLFSEWLALYVQSWWEGIRNHIHHECAVSERHSLIRELKTRRQI